MSSPATPLDQVQAGPGDVTSPQPVDPTSLPTQTPANQIVPQGPDDATVAAQRLNNNQPLSSNPTAGVQAPPSKGGTWRNIVIAGLESLAAAPLNPVAAVQNAALAGEGKGTTFQRMAQAHDQQQQAIQSTLRFKDLQAANAALENYIYSNTVSQLPEQNREAIEDHNLKVAKFLTDNGWSPISVGVHDQQGSARAHLEQLASSSGETTTVAGPDGAPMQVPTIPPTVDLRIGNQNLSFAPPTGNASQTQVDALNELARTAGLPDGITVASFNGMDDKSRGALFQKLLESNRAEARPDQLSTSIARDRGIIEKLKLTRGWDRDAIALVQGRYDAETAAQQQIAQMQQQRQAQAAQQKAQAQAQAAAQKEQLKQQAAIAWRPGVTADEKKKAELAENIAFNAGEVAQILIKRPNLVGAIAGRYTSVEQMVGNNDPDISALGTHIHNIAMANSGVHGFRSQEGVKSYEQQLLNNFKNGPQAVAGALKASTSSVQTFIDNARPDNYRTHSKMGGAVKGMRGF